MVEKDSRTGKASIGKDREPVSAKPDRKIAIVEAGTAIGSAAIAAALLFYRSGGSD